MLRTVVVALALALGAGVAAPSPAAAWSPGACPTSDGVTVVVDFGGLGAGTQVRCVPAVPSTGLAVLVEAGFAVTPVTTLPAFVCRIDGLPDASAESCATTPPATAYWSYWIAPRGGSWTYEPVGASGSTPTAGTVEGWRFVTGNTPQPPGIEPPPPPAAPTARPTPAPTARPTVAPPAATPRPTTTQPPSTATPTPSSSPTPRPTASATATATPTPRPTATATDRPAPAPSPPPPPTPDGPIGTVIGLGLVAAIGAAALVVRRRAGAEHG